MILIRVQLIVFWEVEQVAEDLGNLASIAQEVLGEVSQQQAEEEPKIAGMAETQDPVQEFLEAVQEAMDQSPQQVPESSQKHMEEPCDELQSKVHRVLLDSLQCVGMMEV